MEIEEIEQLVGMVRTSRISELAVTTDGSTVRLRKPLLRVQPAPASRPRSAQAADAPQAAESLAPVELFIAAPMVGIFHSAGNAITEGIAVKAGQSVGAIESMKLMNDVVSEHEGVVAEVLVEDGVPVEYGQLLFRLE